MATNAGKLLQYIGNELEADNNWQQALSYYSKVVNENDLKTVYNVELINTIEEFLNQKETLKNVNI